MKKSRSKAKTCIECKHFKIRGNRGFCQKYQWSIALELAKTQKLCDFEKHHRMPDGKLVITSGVAPHLILLENEKLQKKSEVERKCVIVLNGIFHC